MTKPFWDHLCLSLVLPCRHGAAHNDQPQLRAELQACEEQAMRDLPTQVGKSQVYNQGQGCHSSSSVMSPLAEFSVAAPVTPRV